MGGVWIASLAFAIGYQICRKGSYFDVHVSDRHWPDRVYLSENAGRYFRKMRFSGLILDTVLQAG